MYTPAFADRIVGSAPIRRRQAVARLLGRALGRVEVHGLGRMPDTGPVVIAVNHRDYFDGPLVFGHVHRPVNFLVKIEAFTPRASPYLLSTGQIPVVRNNMDVAAVRFSLHVLWHGGVIGLFPEGARGDGLVRTARPGVAYFAMRTGAKVVPVACHGTDLLKHRRWRRPMARLTIGEPIDLGQVPDGQRVKRRDVLEGTEQVRVALAELVVATAPAAPQAVR
ncbi:MAG TPA: lysophospholipid acyltransferase family protein [Jatrophihabitans sp.]|jgi:1-acyl-sn-glycerol-3-phosphate acyltransferase|nr:lysophospholipid acyltransferase family protein [Jatrophihabitans sp.]